MRRSVVLVCVFPLAGCFSGAGLGRATTLPVGQTRVGGWIEASALTAQLAGPITLPWGLVGAGVHRGVHPRVEVEGRFTGGWLPWLDSISLTGDVKVQLRRRSNGLDVAVVQSVGWRMTRYGQTPWHVLDVLSTLMFGWNFGSHQLIGTVRGGYQLFGGRGQEVVHVGHFDLSIGMAIQVSTHWEFVPEVIVSGSPTRFNGESQDEDRVGTGMIQIALGLARR
jgi:hypothetical protein